VIERIIAFSLRQRALVCMLAVLLIGAGVWAAMHLPIDAVPDISPVQVVIDTRVAALAPEEVEQLVTYPIEVAMSGLPRLDYTRSLSRYGVSEVILQFKDNTDIYWARQLVSERLQTVRDQLPAGLAEPELGPITSGLGEIYFYVVEPTTNSTLTLDDARIAQDWIVKPMLRGVPGVTEVATIGGYISQFQVTPDLVKLRAYGLTLDDLAHAVESNNENAGGSYIERHGEQVAVRSVGRTTSARDLASLVVTTRGGVPIHVSDVAEVGIGHALRGGFSMRGRHETVLGSVLMLLGENTREVAQRVERKIEEVRASLPEGLQITPVYTRSTLVNQTIRTVERNLLHGGLLVFVVLLLTLGHVRAAIIVALAIPLSMMFAMIGMVAGGISGNLMSLGAIDFGLIVDGAVVMTENMVRRVSQKREALGRVLTTDERHGTMIQACQEMGRPVSFAVAIIIMVYLPILTLQGVEGKMFRPMALTVVMALVGSLILALTLVPALASMAIGGRKVHRENWFIRLVAAAYRPTLRLALRWRWVTVFVALVPFAGAVWLFPRLGAVFLPRLEEGALNITVIKLPSASITSSLKMDKQVVARVLRFPEVVRLFTHAGSGDVTTDPMPANDTDVIAILRSPSEWTTAHTLDGLINAMETDLNSNVAGCSFGFVQPIEDRFNDMIAGITSDLGVLIYGDDFDTLSALAQKVKNIVGSTPGAQDVRFEMAATAPVLEIRPGREMLARYGLTISDINELISTALAGRTLGQVIEGDKHFDIVLRLTDAQRADLDVLRNLPVPGPATGLRLADVADIVFREMPPTLLRRMGRRYVVVESMVRGRDLASFVQDVESRIKAGVKLPEGYSISYGGQFETYLAARNRLTVVVPMALLLIFMLLFGAFQSVRQALLVFTGVPLAVTGGVFALWLRGLPFSISAGVGFIALSGVAVLNGVVMVSYINHLREEGKSIDDAVTEGALTRLRPVLMTALVASLGFVPMAIATGTGAEVQRPLATVVIGGLISSTLLTLVVLPVLYRWWERETRPERSPSTNNVHLP
jgi:cobalt-zinc-cadmium resistance protein CzcA